MITTKLIGIIDRFIENRYFRKKSEVVLVNKNFFIEIGYLMESHISSKRVTYFYIN